MYEIIKWIYWIFAKAKRTTKTEYLITQLTNQLINQLTNQLINQLTN